MAFMFIELPHNQLINVNCIKKVEIHSSYNKPNCKFTMIYPHRIIFITNLDPYAHTYKEFKTREEAEEHFVNLKSTLQNNGLVLIC
jgi:hypothetical protein